MTSSSSSRRSREDILRQFAAQLGARPNTSTNNSNLASLLSPNNDNTVYLPCLSNSTSSQSLARPLTLGRSTVDAAPMLLLRNISCSFADSIDARLRGWIHMLRRYLLAQTDTDTDTDTTDDCSAECKEARVLRALHSIAFSIKIVSVKTVLRCTSSSGRSIRSSSGEEAGEEKKAHDDNDYDQGDEAAALTLPLLLEVEVVLSILGETSVITLAAPGTIMGTFDDHTNTMLLLLHRVVLEVDTAVLLSSMRQQARLVVRRAASLKISPNACSGSMIGVGNGNATNDDVDHGVPSLPSASSLERRRPLTPVNVQYLSTVASTTLSMPPPPPRTPLQLPMVSPTASDTTIMVSPGASGIIGLPMPSPSRRKTPLLSVHVGTHTAASSSAGLNNVNVNAMKIINEAHRISPPTASHSFVAPPPPRVEGDGPAFKKQKVTVTVAPMPELRVDRW